MRTVMIDASLVVALVLIALNALFLPASSGSVTMPREQTDIGMYERIESAMRQGTGYYQAAVAEQRAHGYPLRPFYTVRSPVLAEVTAWLGTKRTMNLAQMLVVGCMFAWGFAIFNAGHNIFEATAAALLVGCGGFLAFYLTQLYHEYWAGLLLCLAAALYSRSRPAVAIILATLAVLVREHAIVFPFVMGCFALFGRRWTEVAGWIGAALVCLAFYLFHALQISHLVRDSDLSSQGWLQSPGIFWSLRNLAGISLLRLFDGFSFPLIVFSVTGWLSYKKIGPEIFAFFSAYLILISVTARPENYYWAFVLFPTVLAGLAFVPRQIGELARQFRILRAEKAEAR